ncbi:MAG: hypothetical protein JW818_08725 [Pirellulales bacterium]|nr:hypothetical protein [Pirellulales bacterium]
MSGGPGVVEQGRAAESLAANQAHSGESLGEEESTSRQASFSATAQSVSDVGAPAALLAVQLLQCLVGTGLVLAVVWLTWSLLPSLPELGWVAGLGAAVYPPHVQVVTQHGVALWAAFFLTLLLAVAVSPRWSMRRRGALAGGVLSGVLLLVEPVLVLALPVCLMVFWLGQPNRTSRVALGRVALAVGLAVVIITPWLIRNRLIHGEFIVADSTMGHACWQGDKPNSGTSGEPGHYATLCLQRLHHFLLKSPEATGRLHGTSTAAWLMLVFIGLLVSRSQWRRLWSTYAIFGLVALFNTLVVTTAGGRIPVEPMSFVWASAVLGPWASRLAGRRGVRIYHPGQCPRDPFDSDHVLQGPHFPVGDPLPRRRAG